MKRSPAEKIQTVRTPAQIEGARAGKIVNIDEKGQAFVDFPGNRQGPVAARFTNSITLERLNHAASVGQEILLVFENNDPELPIIINTLYSLLDEITESSTIALQTERPKDVLIDGKRVTFDAKEELILRCGDASIALRNSKIFIRGKDVISRARRRNKIKGGSVLIN